MNKIVLNALAFLVLATTTTACTYNISMAHTEGVAEDTIDDTASNSPTVSPTINLPVIPKIPSVAIGPSSR